MKTLKVIYLYFEHDREAPANDPLLQCFSPEEILSIKVPQSTDISQIGEKILSVCNSANMVSIGVIIVINLNLGGASIPQSLLSEQSTVKETLMAISEAIRCNYKDPECCHRRNNAKVLRSLLLFRHLSKFLADRAVFVFTLNNIGLSHRARSIILSHLRWEGISLMYSWSASSEYYPRNALYLSRIADQLEKMNVKQL